jgi:hypothetical protein
MNWITRPIFERVPGDAQPELTTDPHGSLTDAFLDSYVRWREACEDVRSAYKRWGRSLPPQRHLAFESYRAALEREERAAHIHSDWTTRLRAAQG